MYWIACFPVGAAHDLMYIWQLRVSGLELAMNIQVRAYLAFDKVMSKTTGILL